MRRFLVERKWPVLKTWVTIIVSPPDLRDLNYSKFVEQGEEKITHTEDYNSHNTKRLDIEGMKKLLLKLDFIRAIQRGESASPEE